MDKDHPWTGTINEPDKGGQPEETQAYEKGIGGDIIGYKQG
jgi:hypothetical protein